MGRGVGGGEFDCNAKECFNFFIYSWLYVPAMALRVKRVKYVKYILISRKRLALVPGIVDFLNT